MDNNLSFNNFTYKAKNKSGIIKLKLVIYSHLPKAKITTMLYHLF